MSEDKIAFSEQQKEAIQVVKDGKNALITGMAGTGKSCCLREMSDGRLVICASTGIAALNVGDGGWLIGVTCSDQPAPT